MGQPKLKNEKRSGSKRDSLEDIKTYYRSNQEDTRLDVQQLEFRVTLSLFGKYLKPASNLLELGAGSGRYTLPLLKQGHHVTAIELVEDLTNQNKARVEREGLIDRAAFTSGDARSLIRETVGAFDAVLAMGPFYHLVEEADRDELMNATAEKTRKGGLVITTHLTRLGVVAYMLARFPVWALQSPKQVTQILEAGHLWDHPRNGDFRGYFCTAEEVRDLHESAGLEVIGLHSQDPAIGAVDEIFSALPPELQDPWTEILVKLSEDPLALGSGRSLLCVSRK
jgi:2-polyprenyl-3-methyl-5-hydroxy-6-metoxy-1,4-benzoquinol methylase